MSRRRNALRRERIDLLRDVLIEALGGHCACCGLADGGDLEIDHVDGITWNRYALGREQRIRRYVVEYREGVRLQALCRDCHALKHPRVRQAWAEFAEHFGAERVRFELTKPFRAHTLSRRAPSATRPPLPTES